jgi:hypothetical protein
LGLFFIVALLYLSLHLISSKANEIDEHRTVLSVQGAIQTSVNRVRSLVIDNAVWDDAVRKRIAHSLIPNGSTKPGVRDLKSIISMTAPLFLMKTLTSYGERFTAHIYGTFARFFGKGLQALIRNNSASLISSNDIYAGITRTRSGTAFIGIGLIRPMVVI